MAYSFLWKEAMQNLFTARWNIPQAARHCELSEDVCKQDFRQYCETHPPVYNSNENL